MRGGQKRGNTNWYEPVAVREEMVKIAELLEELAGCWHYLENPAKTDFKELFEDALKQSQAMLKKAKGKYNV